MNIQKLKNLAATDLSAIPDNEQNVKYNIVLAFLNCFGYDQLDLEHAAQGSRIDINIGNKIIIETKAQSKILDSYVSQVKQYCDNERPNLAILTNGKLFRFYSPFMRVSNFENTLIYEFQLSDFARDEVIQRVSKLIAVENYESGSYLSFIQEREDELRQVSNMVRDYDSKLKVDVAAIEKEIELLRSEIEKLQLEISLKENSIEQLKTEKAPEKNELNTKYFIPKSDNAIIPTTRAYPNRVSPIVQPAQIDNTSSYKIISLRVNVSAVGKYYDNVKFTVLKNSTVSPALDPTFGKGSADGAFQLREELIKNGIIVDLRFTEDYTFGSISQAACVVLGGSRSGPREWKRQ